MTIKEMEECSGMTRANIRFYEVQGLLSPARMNNGYRDYTEHDLEILKRIKLLRALHMSLEDIKSLHNGEQNLTDVLQKNFRNQQHLHRLFRKMTLISFYTNIVAAGKRHCCRMLRILTLNPS